MTAQLPASVTLPVEAMVTAAMITPSATLISPARVAVMLGNIK